MFALAITLVVFVSTALLVYQYWTGSLVPAQEESAEGAALPEPIEPTRPVETLPAMDTAA